MSMALDGLSPRSRSTDATTSVDAGRAARKAVSQAAVLHLFASVDDLADHELVVVAAEAGLTHSPQRIRSARAELTEQGVIVQVPGVMRLTKSNYRARVWALADKQTRTEGTSHEREALIIVA